MSKKQKIVMIGPSLEEKGGMGTVSRLIVETVSTEVDIQHISTWNSKPTNRYLVVDSLKVFLQALATFLMKLSLEEVDCVHIHMSERGSVMRKSILIFIALAFQKPIILHTHGAEFHVFHAQLPKLIQKIVNWILQQCTCVIVLSESWKQFYIKNCHLSPEKVVLLHNPVKIPSRIPDRSTRKILKFVFLGKINQRKGIYDLLKAFALLTTEQQNTVQLILAGTGEEEQTRQFTKMLGIDQHVQFPGWINEKQRDDLLSEADVFLLPSYNEGLPMALLEAMSWELPCLTTRVGGIPEVITDQKTGLLVNPGDIQQLKCAMQTLIENESFRLQLGKASRERVQPYNINKYCMSLFELYFAVKRRPQPQPISLVILFFHKLFFHKLKA